MFELLRRKAQSPVIQTAIVIIILVFVFWGAQKSGEDRGNTILTVNGERISAAEYQRTYNQMVNRMKEQFGGSIPEGFMDKLVSKENVLEQLTQRALIKQEAEAVDLRVSDDEVRDAILKYDVFKENGIFNEQSYRSILTAQRMTPVEFEKSIRSDLLSMKVVAAINRFGRVAPDLVEERFRHDNEEIRIAYALFKGESFAEAVKAPEEEIQKFFEEKKESYKTEPQVKLRYLAFLENKAPSDAAVTEEDIQQYYQKNASRYMEQEKRRVRQILVKALPTATPEEQQQKRKKLEEALTKARTGGDFADLAKQYSEDPTAENGGDRGFVTRQQLAGPLADAVFDLQPNEITEIVETPQGSVIVKVEEIMAAKAKDLSIVHDQIKLSLQSQKGKEVVKEQAHKAYQDIILAGSLANYASSSGSQPLETDFFSKKTAPQGPLATPTATNAIFALQKGELSSLIEVPGGYVIAYMEDMKDPEIPAFSAVREKVEKDFRAEKEKSLAKEKAGEMLASLKGGETFNAAAENFKVSMEMSEFFSRAQRSSKGLPNEVIEKALTLTVDSPLPEEVVIAGDGYYVIRVDERKDPGAERFATEKETVESSMKGENSMALFDAWVKSIKAKAKIERNDKILL